MKWTDVGAAPAHRDPPPDLPAGLPEPQIEELLAQARARFYRTLRQKSPSPEQLHRLHQEVRRAQLGYRLVARLAADSGTASHSDLSVDLRGYARLLGEVRESDVSLSILEKGAFVPLRVENTVGLARLRKRLVVAGFEGRRRLAQEGRLLVDSDFWSKLESAVRRAAESSRSGLRPARILDELERQRKRIAVARRRARIRPTARRLHRLRKRIRESELVDALLRPIERPSPSFRSNEPRRLRSRLGKYNDLATLERWMSSQSDRAGHKRLVRRVREVRKRLGEKIERQLDRWEP